MSILKLFLVGVFVSLLILVTGDYFVFDIGLVLGVSMLAGLDGIFSGFFFVRMFVTSSIILFSFWYMSEDVGKLKFVIFMITFLTFIFILTCSGSVLMLLIG